MWFMLSYWLWPESKTSLRYCFLLAFCRSFSCFQILLFILSLKKLPKKTPNPKPTYENLCIFPSETIPSFCSEGITEWSCFVFSLEEYSIVILLCLTLKDSLLPPQMGVTSLSRLAHFLCKSARSDIYAFFLWVCVTG